IGQCVYKRGEIFCSMSELLEFLNRAKTTNETISGLFECVTVADALKNKARMTEESQLQQIAEAMENLYKDFKVRASSIREELEKMKKENDVHLDRHGFDRGFATRNNFMQNLLRRLSLVIQDFGRVQGGFAVSQKERMREQYLIAMPEATEEELSSLDEKEKAKVLLQSAFTLGSKTAKEALILAEKRRSSIENILEGISELKDLADDFSTIVRIDSCDMDKVHLGVQCANTQAKSAHTVINKSSRRKIRIKKAKKTATLFLALLSFTILLIVVCRIAN
ncbi:syntaxin 1B/2/3, partial [Nematocida minor]|uniref:syntaxin 1B/2/3 n=1 Tax=Nematocida minor TaxID=1912983 RepID=UPI00221ED3C6